MFTSQCPFSTRLLVVLTTAALCLAAPVGAQDKSAEIKKLLKERSDLLNNALPSAMAQYNFGTVDITQVVLLQRDGMRAGGELDGPKERLAALRFSLEFAQKFARAVKNRKDAGVAKQLDLDQAMAAVLDARIEVLREEQKQSPAKQGN